MKRIFYIFMSLFCLALTAAGQTLTENGQTTTKPDKPVKVAVVLSGGGAKGMAHIGVLPAIDFVRAYISIIKYVVPTLQSVSMEQNKSKQTTIEETLIKLSGEAEEESKKVYYR